MLLAEFRNESRGTNPNARAVTRRVHASPPWSLELHTAGDGLRREGGMSVEIMAQAWRVPCPSPATKLVLVALADNANDQGVCWPSVPHIARKCNLTDRAVQLAIAALASDGHITTDRRTGRATYYTVHPRTDFTPERISPPNTVHRGGEHSSPVVVNTVHQGGEHSSPRTIIEPSLEPSRGERAPPPKAGEPERTREPNPWWDTTAEVFTLDPAPKIKSHRTRLGQLARDFKALCPDDPGEIARRAARWHRHFPGATCTPDAVLKHWGALGREPDRVKPGFDKWGFPTDD